MPPDNCQSEETNADLNHISESQDFNLQNPPLTDFRVCAPQQDCGDPKPKQRRLSPQTPQTQHPAEDSKGPPCHNTPAVKLKRLPFLESHGADLKTSQCSVYVTNDCAEMSLNSQSEAPNCNSNLNRTASDVSDMEPSFDVPPPMDERDHSSEELASTQLQNEEPQHLHSPADSAGSVGDNSPANSVEHSINGDEMDGDCSVTPVPSTALASSSQDEAQMEPPCSDLNQLELDKPESRQCSDNSSVNSSDILSSSEPSEPSEPELANTSPISHGLGSPADPSPTSELAEDMPEWQLETETYKGDLELDSPRSFPWQDGSDGEDVTEEGVDFGTVSREDRHFVCPVTLRKLLAGTTRKATVRDRIYTSCCSH